jgi:hypothetical protein
MDVLTKLIFGGSLILFALGLILLKYWFYQHHVEEGLRFLTNDPVASRIFGSIGQVSFYGDLQDNYRNFSGTRVEEGEYLYSIKAANYTGTVQVSWISSATQPFNVVRLDEFSPGNDRKMVWLK